MKYESDPASAGFFYCRFIMMMQLKYIIFAILLLLVCALFFLGVKEISKTPAGDRPQVIDSGIIPGNSGDGYPDGAAIFRARCASCHIMGQDATGPNLSGFMDRGPWRDTLVLLNYLTGSGKIKRSKYLDSLKNVFPIDLKNHVIFEFSEKELSALITYISNFKTQFSVVID